LHALLSFLLSDALFSFCPAVEKDFWLYVTPPHVVFRLGIASLCLLEFAILWYTLMSGCQRQSPSGWSWALHHTRQSQARPNPTNPETVQLAMPVKESSVQAFDVEK